MKIEIKQFIRDERGFKVGYVDFNITYSEEKSETFRNWAVFIKEGKKWISDPKIKREIKEEDGSVKEKWMSIYERNPRLPKEIYSEVLAQLERDNLIDYSL